MRQDKLTTKFQQALGEAQSLALAHDNQYIEPVHLLLAVMNDQEGSASSLIERSGGNAKRVRDEAQAAVERLPKVTGTSGDVQVSRDLIRALNLTEKEAMQRGDQFISTEMFLLALASADMEASRILASAGVTKKLLEAAIEAVRGGEDGSGGMAVLSHKRLLALAVATSIDALAIGVSFAFSPPGPGVVLSCAVIGCTTFLIAFGGAMAASRIPGIRPKTAEIAGGIILVGIGVKLLLEGLLK